MFCWVAGWVHPFELSVFGFCMIVYPIILCPIHPFSLSGCTNSYVWVCYWRSILIMMCGGLLGTRSLPPLVEQSLMKFITQRSRQIMDSCLLFGIKCLEPTYHHLIRNQNNTNTDSGTHSSVAYYILILNCNKVSTYSNTNLMFPYRDFVNIAYA